MNQLPTCKYSIPTFDGVFYVTNNPCKIPVVTCVYVVKTYLVCSSYVVSNILQLKLCCHFLNYIFWMTAVSQASEIEAWAN